jgi:hypothetical protein
MGSGRAATHVQEVGNFLLYTFDKYAPGIEYHANSVSVVAFIDNGLDRLFDNNDSVILVQESNWQYKNPHCRF